MPLLRRNGRKSARSCVRAHSNWSASMKFSGVPAKKPGECLILTFEGRSPRYGQVAFERQRLLLPLLQSRQEIFRDATFPLALVALLRRLEVRKARAAFLPSRDDSVESPIELRLKPRRQPLAAQPARDVGRALRSAQEPDHLVDTGTPVLSNAATASRSWWASRMACLETSLGRSNTARNDRVQCLYALE